MRTILRLYIISTLSLFLCSLLFQGIVLGNGLQGILIAGGALTVISLLIKPVINILLLPINLLTFGLFRWVSSAVSLYLVSLVAPGFKIYSFTFLGFFSKWIDIPNFSLNGILAFIAFSFAISVMSTILHWLIAD